MPQQGLDENAHPPEAASDAPRSLREYIKTALINTIPPLAAYYALRILGVVPYLALVGAIVTAAAQGALTMARKRKVEPANVLVLVGAACSLSIAFITKNPRVVQLIELIPMSLIVWSFMLSGLLNKPNSKKVAGMLSPNLSEAALVRRGWTEHDAREWHTLHTRISLWLGLACGAFPFLAVYWIVHFSVDVSQMLIVVIGPTLVVLSVAGAVMLLRRFIQEKDAAVVPHPRQPDNVPE